ncbi:signal peptidase I [Arthrobacter sp. NPDC056493]|uniref:signal peptidase I n=1 Tax=Arthrobacter sp. NPDC056493 TaxID=3345839 RepID=UPI00366DC616
MSRTNMQGRLGNALLNVAALGGTVCIVLVILAFFFQITLIMFKTGSMSPTIPAGSLAVVKKIPASEARVGDVVTVDRASALPVTHRVTSVMPAEGGAAKITMRGDANPTDDPLPYEIQTVRIVLWSVPELAYTVNAANNPLILGGLSVVMAVVVTWAFWPREEPRRRGRRAKGEPEEAAT